MYFDEKHNSEVKIFDSLHELKGQLERRPGAFDRIDLDADYFLGRTFSSRDDLLASIGRKWDYGLEKTDEMMRELRDLNLPNPRSVKRRPRWDDSDGDEVDWDRLRDGQDYWRTTTRRRVTAPPRVVVICNIAALGMISADSILWRGAAALCLTDILERAGYRVEVWSVSYSQEVYTDGLGMFSAVCVKTFSDYVDRISLINSGSGWFFRTVGFAIRCSSETRRVVEGFGQSRGVGDFVEYLSPREENRVVIENVFDKQAAADLVRGAVMSLDVTMSGV